MLLEFLYSNSVLAYTCIIICAWLYLSEIIIISLSLQMGELSINGICCLCALCAPLLSLWVVFNTYLSLKPFTLLSSWASNSYMYSLGQFPALFLACLTLLAIVSMAVGKYYSVTKSLSLLKTREPPNIEQLNHELQELVSMNIHGVSLMGYCS